MSAIIARRLINAAIDSGHSITVHNGEDEPVKESRNVRACLRALMQTDEERLIFHKDGKRVGWVFLVYGNDGYDVINDYTMSIEPIIKPTFDYACSHL